MFFRNDFTFGGNNGLTDFKFILGHEVNSPVTKRWLYIASGTLLLVAVSGLRWLTSTKFGMIQRAIRDSENRVLFSGYATANFKLFVFVLSAVICGLGGALFVPQVGIINPSEMAPDKSLEAVVWCAVGGRGNLLGPILRHRLQLAQELRHARVRRAMALHSRRALRLRDAFHAEGHHRHP